MKIYIAADHGGFELKGKLKEFIKSTFNYDIEDLGAYELNPTDDYPIFAKNLAMKIIDNPQALGILICRTGIGMSIAANRFSGIFAALCTTKEHAVRSRQHENANILCLDAEFISEESNKEILRLFLTTDFSHEERLLRRINQIKKIEEL